MKKLFILGLVALLTAPVLAIAANDVTVPQKIDILLPGDGLTYYLDNSSVFDSVAVNTDDIMFTVSASSDIQLISPNKKNFTVTYGLTEASTYVTYAISCSGTSSLLAISVSSHAPSDYEVTVVPSGTASCSAGGGGGGGGGAGSGGGGGGGSTATPTETTTATAATISGLDNYSSGGGAVTLAAPASASVTTGGGSAALANNNVAVSVPANAVSGNATLAITPQANYAQPAPGYSAVGTQAYSISAQVTGGAAITQFASNLTVTFNYTDAQIANIDESTLVVSYWSETTGAWVNLATTIDKIGNKVTAAVNHLTKFILQGKSAVVPLGSLIKTADSSAVYYLGHDNQRYVFPDDKVYSTWYADFKSVVTVTKSQMTGFNLGGNVTARPGTKLIQFVAYDYAGKMVVDDPHIYAVEPGGIRHWLKTAEVAAALYGTKWEQKIIPVPNYLINNYQEGTAITAATYPAGSLVKETSSNNLYYISGGEKRLVTANGKVSNCFQDQFVLSATSLASYTAGTSVNDYQNSVSWTGGK